MQPADWVIVAVIIISMVFGLLRGLVREAFSLAGWLAALLVARTFFEPFDQMLSASMSTPSLRHMVAYGGLFVGTLIVAWLLGYAVMSLVDAAGLKWSDRLLGGIFGFGRGLIVVLALLIVVQPFVEHDPWWHSAELPPEFLKYAFLGKELKQDVMQVALPPPHKGRHGTPSIPRQ
jgi:membrane protein required for colicin V production